MIPDENSDNDYDNKEDQTLNKQQPSQNNSKLTWMARNILPIFFGIFLITGIVIASVPSWRDATVKYFQQFGPSADTLDDASSQTVEAPDPQVVGKPTEKNIPTDQKISLIPLKNNIILPSIWLIDNDGVINRQVGFNTNKNSDLQNQYLSYKLEHQGDCSGLKVDEIKPDNANTLTFNYKEISGMDISYPGGQYNFYGVVATNNDLKIDFKLLTRESVKNTEGQSECNKYDTELTLAQNAHIYPRSELRIGSPYLNDTQANTRDYYNKLLNSDWMIDHDIKNFLLEQDKADAIENSNDRAALAKELFADKQITGWPFQTIQNGSAKQKYEDNDIGQLFDTNYKMTNNVTLDWTENNYNNYYSKMLFPFPSMVDFNFYPIYLQAYKVTNNQEFYNSIAENGTNFNLYDSLKKDVLRGVEYSYIGSGSIKYKIDGDKGQLGFIKRTDKPKGKQSDVNDKYEYKFEPLAGDIPLNSKGVAENNNSILVYKPADDQGTGRVWIDFTLTPNTDFEKEVIGPITNNIFVDVEKVDMKVEVKDKAVQENENFPTKPLEVTANFSKLNKEGQAEPLTSKYAVKVYKVTNDQYGEDGIQYNTEHNDIILKNKDGFPHQFILTTYPFQNNDVTKTLEEKYKGSDYTVTAAIGSNNKENTGNLTGRVDSNTGVSSGLQYELAPDEEGNLNFDLDFLEPGKYILEIQNSGLKKYKEVIAEKDLKLKVTDAIVMRNGQNCNIENECSNKVVLDGDTIRYKYEIKNTTDHEIRVDESDIQLELDNDKYEGVENPKITEIFDIKTENKENPKEALQGYYNLQIYVDGVLDELDESDQKVAGVKVVDDQKISISFRNGFYLVEPGETHSYELNLKLRDYIDPVKYKQIALINNIIVMPNSSESSNTEQLTDNWQRNIYRLPDPKIEVLNIADENHKIKEEDDKDKDKLFLGDYISYRVKFEPINDLENLDLRINLPNQTVLVPSDSISSPGEHKIDSNGDQYINWHLEKLEKGKSYEYLFELQLIDQIPYKNENNEVYSETSVFKNTEYNNQLNIQSQLSVNNLNNISKTDTSQIDIWTYLTGKIIGPYKHEVPGVNVSLGILDGHRSDARGDLPSRPDLEYIVGRPAYYNDKDFEILYSNDDGEYKLPLNLKLYLEKFNEQKENNTENDVVLSILYSNKNVDQPNITILTNIDSNNGDRDWLLWMTKIPIIKDNSISKEQKQDINIYQQGSSDPKPIYPIISYKNHYLKSAMAAEDWYWIYNAYKLMKEKNFIDKYVPLDIMYRGDNVTESYMGNNIGLGKDMYEFTIDRYPHVVFHELTHALDYNNWGNKKGDKCYPNTNCIIASNHQGYANDVSNDSLLEAVASFLPQYMYSQISGKPYNNTLWHINIPIEDYDKIDRKVWYAVNTQLPTTGLPAPALAQNEEDAITSLWQHIFGDLNDAKVSEFLNYYKDSNNITDFYDKMPKSYKVDELFKRAGIFYDANGNWQYDFFEEIGRPANGVLFPAQIIEYLPGTNNYHAKFEWINSRHARKIPPIIGSNFIFNTANATQYFDDIDFNVKRYYNNYNFTNVNLADGSKDSYNIEIFNDQENEIEVPSVNKSVIVTADNASNYYAMSSEEYSDALSSGAFAYLGNLTFDNLSTLDQSSGLVPMTLSRAIELETQKQAEEDAVYEQYLSEHPELADMQNEIDKTNEYLAVDCDGLLGDFSVVVMPIINDQSLTQEEKDQKIEELHQKETECKTAQNELPQMQVNEDHIEQQITNNEFDQLTTDPVQESTDRCQLILSDFSSIALNEVYNNQDIPEDQKQSAVDALHEEEGQCNDALNQITSEPLINEAMQESRDEVQQEEYQQQLDQLDTTEIIKSMDDRCNSLTTDFSQVSLDEIFNNQDFQSQIANLSDEDKQTKIDEALSALHTEEEQCYIDAEDATSKYSDSQLSKAASIIQELLDIKNNFSSQINRMDLQFLIDNKDLILDCYGVSDLYQLQGVSNFPELNDQGELEDETYLISCPDLRQKAIDHEKKILNYENDQQAKYMDLSNTLQKIINGEDPAYFGTITASIDLAKDYLFDVLKIDSLFNWLNSFDNEDNEDQIDGEIQGDISELNYQDNIDEYVTIYDNLDPNYIPEPASPPELPDDRYVTEFVAANVQEDYCPDRTISGSDYLYQCEIDEFRNYERVLFDEKYNNDTPENIVNRKEELTNWFIGNDNQYQDRVNHLFEFFYPPLSFHRELLCNMFPENPFCSTNQQSSIQQINKVAIKQFSKNAVVGVILNLFQDLNPFSISKANAQEEQNKQIENITSMYITKEDADPKEENAITKLLAGQTVVLNGKNFTNSKNIQIYLNDTFLEDAKILGGGFGIKLMIPTDTKTGNYTIKLIGDSQGEYVFKDITVKHPINYNWIWYTLGIIIILAIAIYLLILRRRRQMNQVNIGSRI